MQNDTNQMVNDMSLIIKHAARDWHRGKSQALQNTAALVQLAVHHFQHACGVCHKKHLQTIRLYSDTQRGSLRSWMHRESHVTAYM